MAKREVVAAEPMTENARALVGCGRNLPDQKIVIADPDTLTACPANHIGEIWVNGPSVAHGYWQQEEATNRTFRATLADTGEGPFLRTGDLGFLQDGELFVTGRLKDLIIVHGVNYYPQDIERTVQHSHPRLRVDCGGAFTVEVDGREQLVIVQEIERHKQSDFHDVFSAIHRAVTSEFELAPDVIVLIRAGSVPKTSSGKIQRHACRDGFLAGTLDVVSQYRASDAAQTEKPAVKDAAKEDNAARREAIRFAVAQTGKNGHHLPVNVRLTQLVLEEIYRVAKERAKGMTLDSPIVETGMDSLERMEILASLEEKFGGRFPEEIYPELDTTRQLVAAVEKYLGTEPRPTGDRAAATDIPPSAYRFDQFPEYIKLRENLDMLNASGLGNPFFVVHDGPTTDTTTIAGRKLINFSSYNYIAMSGDPVVSAAAKAAIDRYGTSSSASRLVSGQKEIHVELEREISRFLGTEDTIALVGGHATNETVIGHLMGPGDLILHDALAHNSIVQGCILSGARRRPFPHNDWAAADRLLAQYRHEYRRVLIAIEGVYSMDGDFPDLPRFVEVKKRHHAMLMIDEAHSLGVLGATGRGIAEKFGVPRADVDVWMGTLSKSLGSCGGYISGQKALPEYLRYTAPGFVFAAAMPPSNAAAAIASIRLLEAEPQRVARLHENAQLFVALAREHGLNTGMSNGTPVVPVILGNSIHCLMLSKAMLNRGVNVQPILHPAVEEKASRLRYFITAAHNEEQIRYTIQAMVEELEKIDAGHLRRVRDTAAVAG
jgi:8-amino-7-oxononanoate synthase